jgi:large subunit ribosomal protein L15
MANELSDLAPNPGSRKTRMRVGRGEGSGKGKTAGRGTKGDKSRSGYKTRPYFEGGQMPLHRRLPKRGFNNHDFARDIETLNVARLDGLAAGTVVTADMLLSTGAISRVGKDGVKVLGNGDITVAVHLKGLLVSGGARDKIVAAGGSVE